MKTKLAVIIPAYKKIFFRQTLESLAKQSDKRFKVYVGDDASPENLQPVVDEYSSLLDITYVRFGMNLGRKDLVAHWNRCLEMVGNEDFVCLFSDDDIMEENCVRQFYVCMETNPDYDVYHFNINIIDKDGTVISEPGSFPESISHVEFFKELYMGRIDARMPEFIFRTSILKSKGFVSFPRAYRSDNATVISCASGTGIRTITGLDAKVLWRDSGINMSSSAELESLACHSDANISFFNWSHKYFGKEYPLSANVEKRWIVNLLASLYPDYSLRELFWRLLKYYRPVGGGNMTYRIETFFYLVKVIRRKYKQIRKIPCRKIMF